MTISSQVPRSESMVFISQAQREAISRSTDSPPRALHERPAATGGHSVGPTELPEDALIATAEELFLTLKMRESADAER